MGKKSRPGSCAEAGGCCKDTWALFLGRAALPNTQGDTGTLGQCPKWSCLFFRRAQCSLECCGCMSLHCASVGSAQSRGSWFPRCHWSLSNNWFPNDTSGVRSGAPEETPVLCLRLRATHSHEGHSWGSPARVMVAPHILWDTVPPSSLLRCLKAGSLNADFGVPEVAQHPHRS